MRVNLFACLAFLAPLCPTVAEAQIDHVPLFRVELRVHTCDKSNAGTGDEVWVQLNDGMNRYYLDGAGEDRNRGAWNTYDIVTDDLASVADIQHIRIGNTGSDAWCFDSVYLYINRNDGGVEPANLYRIYAIALASTWIDGPGAHPDFHQLNNIRSNLTWASTAQRVSTLSAPMDEIRGETLRQMFEDAYGNGMSREGFMYDWAWRSGGTITVTTLGFTVGRLSLGLRQSGSNKTLVTTYMMGHDCDQPGGEWTSLYFITGGILTVNGATVTNPAVREIDERILETLAAGFERNLIGSQLCEPGVQNGTAIVNSVGDIQF